MLPRYHRPRPIFAPARDGACEPGCGCCAPPCPRPPRRALLTLWLLVALLFVLIFALAPTVAAPPALVFEEVDDEEVPTHEALRRNGARKGARRTSSIAAVYDATHHNPEAPTSLFKEQ
jgi:hypothetical protein